MRALLLIGAILLAIPAGAETETVLAGRCHTERGDFSLFLTAGDSLSEGVNLSVISSEISSVTGLNLTTAGVYRPSRGQVELPTYWRPQILPISACQMTTASAPPRALRAMHDVPMYIQLYFIAGDPSPDVDLDELVKNHQAIPLKAHIICRTDELNASSPLACRRVRFLDEIIPIDPPPGGRRLAARGLANPSVAALESRICGASTFETKATASVVSFNGQRWVLTSAAAVASDRGERTCNEMILADGRRVPLTLVKQDFAYGLAALKLPDNVAVAAREFRGAISAPDRADLIGVAKAVAQVQTNSVEILAQASSRHFIPRLKSVIETLGAPVDSGFMGATLADESGALLGVVSHQYLKIFPGSYTRPLRWRAAESESSDHLVVIPAEAVKEWLSRIETREPMIWESSIAAGVMQIQSGDLKITEDCPPMDSSQSNGEYPIGGVDPVGIGGDSSNYRACRIQVSLSPAADSRFAVPELQDWHDRMKAALAAGNRISLSYTAWRGSRAIEHSYFYSAESFFQEMFGKKSDHLIVESIARPQAPVAGLDPRFDAVRALADREAGLSRQIYVRNSFGDPNVGSLLRRIYLLSILIESEQKSLVTANDFRELMDKNGVYGKAWGYLELVAGAGGLAKGLDALYQEWLKTP